MAASNFDACMAQVAKWEGWGKTTFDHYDPGGLTKSGVTQRAYDGWRRSKGLPIQSVGGMTDAEAYAIYRADYWDVLKCDAMPKGLDCILFSTGVNMGAPQAAKFLQRAVGVNADGWIGGETLNAVQRSGAVKFLIQSIAKQRASFWQRLKTFWRYGKGWMARGADDERVSLEMTA